MGENDEILALLSGTFFAIRWGMQKFRLIGGVSGLTGALVFQLLTSGCGKPPSDNQEGGTAVQPTFGATSTNQGQVANPLCDVNCCIKEMQQMDQDGDGATDYDEAFGQTFSYFGQQVTIATDPTQKQTPVPPIFGMAETTSDANFQITAINRQPSIVLSPPIQVNPYNRDYIVRVFAKGGTDSAENANMKGWNYYSDLQWEPGESIRIQELTAIPGDGWSIDANQMNAKGWKNPRGIPVNLGPFGVCAGNICIHKSPRGELIGKFISEGPSQFGGSKTPYSEGPAPFDIGNSMDTTNFVGGVPLPTSGDRYLILRMNWFGDARISRVSGYIDVLVSFSKLKNPASSAITPPAANDPATLRSYCSSAVYQQKWPTQLTF